MWVQTFDTIEDLRQTLLAFRESYNATWLIERHGFITPAAFRHKQLQPAALAAYVNAARIFLKTAEVNFPSVGGQPLARSWLFFGGRPRRLGIGAGVGGAMTALERTCSGINSACCRSR